MASSASRSSLSNLITKLISVPISFGTSMILAILLGPELRGTLSYLLLFYSFSMPILNLGFGTGVTYYLSKKDFNVSDTFFTSMIIAVIQGSIGSLLLFVFWKNSFLINDSFISSGYDLLPLFFLLPLNAVLFYTERTLIGKSKFIFINYMALLQPVVYLASLSVVYFFDSIDIVSVMYCVLLYNSIRTVISIVRIVKEYKIDIKFNKYFISKISNYGIRGWFGGLALVFNLRIDQFFLGAIDVYFLGVYVIAVQLAEILWVIPDSLGPVLFNQISAENDQKKQLLLIEKIHRILFCLVFILSLFAGFIGYIFIPIIFGEEYADSVYPFLLILPGIVMQTSVKVLTKIFAGSGKIEFNSYITLFGMVVSIILYVVLIPEFNVMGAAISSSIGYSSSSLLAYFIAYKKFSINILSFFIPRQSDIAWAKSKFLKK